MSIAGSAAAPLVLDEGDGSVTVVWGVPFQPQDFRAAKLARTVLNTALAMSFVALASAILTILSGIDVTAGVMAGVLIPCCGYWAVSRRSRPCLLAFVAANALVASYFLLSFIVAEGELSHAQAAMLSLRPCCSAVRRSFACPCSLLPARSLGTCTAAAFHGDFVSCACDLQCRAERMRNFDPQELDKICADRPRYAGLWWSGIAVSFVMAGLQIVGCVKGQRLLRTSYFDRAYAVTALPVDALPVGTFATIPGGPAGGHHAPTAPPALAYAQQAYGPGSLYGARNSYAPGGGPPVH